MAYVRTVKTYSGATAVQIVWSSTRGSRKIEHLGSAHTDLEIEALKIAAAKRLAGDQDELDLGLEVPAEVAAARPEPLPILSSRMGHLWEALSRAYDVLGFDEAHSGRCAACPGRKHGCPTSWHDVHVDGAKVGYGPREAG